MSVASAEAYPVHEGEVITTAVVNYVDDVVETGASNVIAIHVNGAAGEIETTSAEPVNPFAELAQSVAANAVTGDIRARTVPASYLIGRAFQGVHVPKADRRAFKAALIQVPGVEYLGDQQYKITPVVEVNPEGNGRIPIAAEPGEKPDILDLVADQVVMEIRPGTRFQIGVLYAIAKSVSKGLSTVEVEHVLAKVIGDGRITAYEDGAFSLNEDMEVRATPREALPFQPAVTSDNVVRRATLDGMLKVLERSQRKPRPKKHHSGWKRPRQM